MVEEQHVSLSVMDRSERRRDPGAACQAPACAHVHVCTVRAQQGRMHLRAGVIEPLIANNSTEYNYGRPLNSGMQLVVRQSYFTCARASAHASRISAHTRTQHRYNTLQLVSRRSRIDPLIANTFIEAQRYCATVGDPVYSEG
jgi:hypothetical protein